ncbi:Hypothetical protein OINT_2001504 [Brucella intermedia LMG 3301]|uniref:Uncharacterized protein n=1 Tax=Brucella intermedia LMG 3301 TaxID=641118 RepID=C4WPT6_9HYPH|nr:Hypothetical protein OINT_2001504 [Brucella intermedia LMG 3301]
MSVCIMPLAIFQASSLAKCPRKLDELQDWKDFALRRSFTGHLKT